MDPKIEQLRRLIQYSEKYYDSTTEYRHVYLPKELSKMVPRDRHLSEYEWRSLGIQMSKGWIHYGHHDPEPHILLFKRPYQGVTPRAELEQKLEQIPNNAQTQQKQYTSFSFQ